MFYIEEFNWSFENINCHNLVAGVSMLYFFSFWLLLSFHGYVCPEVNLSCYVLWSEQEMSHHRLMYLTPWSQVDGDIWGRGYGMVTMWSLAWGSMEERFKDLWPCPISWLLFLLPVCVWYIHYSHLLPWTIFQWNCRTK